LAVQLHNTAFWGPENLKMDFTKWFRHLLAWHE